MATKKTQPFVLTERLTASTGGSVVSGTIDLGSYVDVGDRQALMIHSVDYILQGITATTDLTTTFNADTEVITQVQDYNRGGFVFADDRALVSSMRFIYDNAQNGSMDADIYPDNFGKGALDGRIVVNDALYLYLLSSDVNTANAVNVTVRVTASIVTLSQKDFMAIAIQSTASDN